MTLPKTFCPAPWISLSTDVNGSIRPCCRYAHPVNQTTAKMPWMKDGELHETFNSAGMQKLRESFLKGEKPSECDWCWKEEDVGLFSFRQNYIKRTVKSQYDIDIDVVGGHPDDYVDHMEFILDKETPSPELLDLKLTNTCNLKCRMCGPQASSLIGKEMGVHDPYWSENKIIGTDNEESFFKHILPNVREIDLTGGEPFFSNENQQLLIRVSESEYVDNIDKVFITTNGMSSNKRLLNALEKFKRVKITVSVDDVGKRLAYARHGARWNTIEQNVNKFKEYSNIQVGFHRTINLLNVLYLDELEEAVKKIGVKMSSAFLHEPFHLGIQTLPPMIKEEISNKLGDTYVTRFMNGVNDESYDHLRKFLSEMNRLDSIRNESFKDTFPELYDLVGWVA